MDMLPSDSDWESFSDNGSSSEDIEELDFLYGGRASSIFSSLEESIGKIDDFLSFERGFVHGDVVSSASDPSGQMGRVVNVNMLVNLENSHGKIIKDVDSKTLLKIRSISVGDYVVHGAWIGRVDKVVDNVTVVFDDGTSCEVTGADQEKLMPISSNILDDPTYPYYPGQRVQIRLSAVSKSARWLCGVWKENQDVGTVSAVKAGSVYVDWLACALVDLSLPAPQRLQDARNLTLLSCFLHENWQLGDWCMLPLADCKGMNEQVFFDASIIKIIKEDRRMGHGFKGQNPCLNFQDIFVIVKTKTVVDVVWQDGGCSQGLDSQSLLPVNVVNAHDFLPGQFVLEKGACDDPHVSGNQKWGVVNCVDAKERTVMVKWKSIGVNQVNNVGSGQVEETVSAYELVEHPDYSYSYGDFVFKNLDQAHKDHMNRETGMDADYPLEGSDHGKDQVDYLSCIGYVTGFEDGSVKVTWASSLKTKVSPNDIFRIDKNEVSAETMVQHEQREEEVNQETVDHDKQFSVLKGKDLLNSISINDESAKCPWESSSFSLLPQSALGFFTRITEGIFGSLSFTSVPGTIASDPISEDGNEFNTPEEKENLETCDLCMEMQPLVAGDMLRFEGTNLKLEINDDQESKEHRSSSASKRPERFNQFDMVADCSDHHFLDGAGNVSAMSQVKRGWLRKVQQEWSILENNLPESIYVRVYEERMDLLRAVIVGSNGTPYHDGLFFFDIFLPPGYPHEPPLVHYRSGGLRVNPNLYESGKICLSLLNTWTGSGSEVWNPESSSILQVLLSLQALVLNEKPYFNEAGYDKQIGRAEGEKNSISYNENAFLVTWKSMLYLLRQPPKHFEPLIEDHLKLRSQNILLACKSYLEGAPVVHALDSGSTDHENHQKGGSTGFKIMLGKLFPKLIEAFSGKGIDCSQFTEEEE
ncbi:UBIQUITIN-CONJUGATING ENZYME E2 24-RELATED [Salix viminalis]|uniref:E2 ubiquitin-conjugating enzyme n=1 Tax=Salix viminalis TaxID=40686 RepID=A0A9Q0Z8B7_SALVM|nr:UBIQUITIN-CONJUGATING ENZYME E2 24-RELATED [Salix viminalis]